MTNLPAQPGMHVGMEHAKPIYFDTVSQQEKNARSEQIEEIYSGLKDAHPPIQQDPREYYRTIELGSSSNRVITETLALSLPMKLSDAFSYRPLLEAVSNRVLSFNEMEVLTPTSTRATRLFFTPTGVFLFIDAADGSSSNVTADEAMGNVLRSADNRQWKPINDKIRIVHAHQDSEFSEEPRGGQHAILVELTNDPEAITHMLTKSRMLLIEQENAPRVSLLDVGSLMQLTDPKNQQTDQSSTGNKAIY